MNCSGQDFGQVAKCFGSKIEVDTIQGSMFITNEHISDHFITTCGVNFDGNAIVPIKGSSSIGSTWITGEEPEEEVQKRVATNVKRIVNKDVKFDQAKSIKGFQDTFQIQ